MSLLVSIDPGLRYCGVATFRGQDLESAALVKNSEQTQRGPRAWWFMGQAVWEVLGHPWTLVIEHPQAYQSRFQKGRQNDLLELAGVVGAVVGCGPTISDLVGYLPRDWKGTVDPDVMLERIEGRLSEAEKARIEKCPKSLRHNVIDAIGIGLYHLGRL